MIDRNENEKKGRFACVLVEQIFDFIETKKGKRSSKFGIKLANKRYSEQQL